ncbi:MAG TPA: hypothetical protein VMR31_14120 [Myxococcota bacterium]|nr:hypothetical protein [Myxococcota bacterium]
MADLSERESKHLRAVRATQRRFAAAGVVLVLLGAAYVTWGVLHFNPHGDPRVDPGFDGPVAKLAFLFDRGLEKIDNTTPQTPTEAFLLHALSRNMQFSTGVMVMLMRIFLGLFTLVTGLLTMTVVVERGRLLRVIKRLEE